MAFWFNNKGYPLTKPIHILTFKPFNMLDKIRVAKLGIYCRLRKNWNSLRGIRADIWLNKIVGKKVREILFENLAKIKFGKLSSVDIAWFGSRLHEAAKTREKYAYLTCGIHKLVMALKNDIIKRGGKIKTNAKLEKNSRSKN